MATALSRVLVLGFVLLLPLGARAQEDVLCEGCELHLGVGNTYHFWSRTGGVVIPATFTWEHDRYELGVFRLNSSQTLYEARWRDTQLLAQPYWAFTLSRRWRLVGTERWRLFFGFGAAYKNEADALNATHWNFASQLGVRLRMPGERADLEVSMRHWSNGGIRLPNRGQDFCTVSFAF